jgi:hypothetical protein
MDSLSALSALVTFLGAFLEFLTAVAFLGFAVWFLLAQDLSTFQVAVLAGLVVMIGKLSTIRFNTREAHPRGE